MNALSGRAAGRISDAWLLLLLLFLGLSADVLLLLVVMPVQQCRCGQCCCSCRRSLPPSSFISLDWSKVPSLLL